jgi:hypothetical protein
VVSLGKMNPIVNAKVTALALPVGKSRSFLGGREVSVFEIVILTNHAKEPHGTISCTNPFTPMGSASIRTQARVAMISVTPPERVSGNEYKIWVQNSGATWTSDNPIYMPVTSDKNELGDCSFTPQE